MTLYLQSLKMHFKSLLEYKSSFIIGFLSQFLVFFTYYFIIIALFDKFDNVKGFTLYEVLLTFAIIQFGYAFNEVFARGIDKFDRLIINGSFDLLLLRPQKILLQVLCSEINYIKLSRLLQAIIVLIIAIVNLNLDWNIYKIITLILMLISSIIIFLAIFLLMASYCFLTVQGLEVRNVFTDGGKNLAQYPIGIFNKYFVIIFTFIIPYAFVNYYPLLFILGRLENKILIFSPLVVLLYLFISFKTSKWGMKKYTSTGS